MTQWTNAGMLTYVRVADTSNILCDYQFVFSVLNELYVSQHFHKVAGVRYLCEMHIFNERLENLFLLTVCFTSIRVENGKLFIRTNGTITSWIVHCKLTANVSVNVNLL